MEATMFVNPKGVLAAARREGWAVGGFNVYNLESARAVVQAAEEERAPVMVQTSEGAVKHAGMAELAGIVRALAEGASVPVALHMDHGKSITVARAAIDAGYTSVMIDTSRLPLEQNIAATREIVEYARSYDVQVEAELGQLAGIEDVGDVPAEATFTVADDAVRFVAETGADSLAITIGTSHGAFKFAGEPRLDFARLADIASRIPIPLVLHGASAVNQGAVALAERYGARLLTARGLPDELIRQAVPSLTRVAYIWNPANPAGQNDVRNAEAAARTLGLQLRPLGVKSDGDLDAAFARASRDGVRGLLVMADFVLYGLRGRIVELAAQYRLPGIYETKSFVEAGGLLAYGVM
jgi:fructose-bisphosphate aldolase, class II